MYHEPQKPSATPDGQEPRRRSTRSNPANASESSADSSTSTIPASWPQRNIHSAPTQYPINNNSSRSTDFYSAATYPPPSFVHTRTTTSAENAANRLRDLQQRFLKGTMKGSWEDDGSRRMEVIGLERLDRRTVINIYDQALDTLGKAPTRYEQIVAECNRKTRIAMGVITAEPYDEVFGLDGQMLNPLDPQYAEPRIRQDDDENGYRAQWRLNAWRRDGWPRVYPMKAIQKEAEEADEKLVGKDAISDARMMIKMHNDANLWEEGDVEMEFTAPEKARRKKTAKERPQKVIKKNMMTVMQTRQKIMGENPVIPTRAAVSTRPRMTTVAQPTVKSKSNTYRRIVVDTLSPSHSPEKKQGRRRRERHNRIEVSETSQITSEEDED